MKLLSADKNQFIFHLGKREKELLFELIGRYPLVPATSARHHVSTKGTGDDEPQRLLDEALATHRQESKRQVLAMLNEPKRFHPDSTGYKVALSPPQVEWLLQALNDVRVGSWIALGSPDTEKGERVPLNAKTLPHLWPMEAAGHFEASLIEAVGGD